MHQSCDGANETSAPIKILTFGLVCFIAFVICFGSFITVLVGIAYGYNYSLAEFLTFTKSDVTVFMRRGQFYDNPDLVVGGSRRMADGVDQFPANIPGDYEERDFINKESEPLSDKWLKDEDAREYAKKLTKYSGIPKTYSSKPDIQMQLNSTTSQATRRFSKILNLMQTTVWQRRGSSEIVMRKFLPINEVTEESRRKEPSDYFYDANKPVRVMKPSEIVHNERQFNPKGSVEPNIKIRFDDIPERKTIPISDNTSDLKHAHDQDDISDEEDEDSVMYKPV